MEVYDAAEIVEAEEAAIAKAKSEMLQRAKSEKRLKKGKSARSVKAAAVEEGGEASGEEKGGEKGEEKGGEKGEAADKGGIDLKACKLLGTVSLAMSDVGEGNASDLTLTDSDSKPVGQLRVGTLWQAEEGSGEEGEGAAGEEGEAEANIKMVSVEVKVIEGKRLPKADLFGSSDPFVTLEWDGRKVHKTKVIRNTLDPVWTGEKVVVQVPSAVRKGEDPPHLAVQVWDYDRVGASDLLGEAVVDWPTLLKPKRARNELKLRSAGGADDGKGKQDAGMLALQIRVMSDDGDDSDGQHAGETLLVGGHINDLLGEWVGRGGLGEAGKGHHRPPSTVHTHTHTRTHAHAHDPLPTRRC